LEPECAVLQQRQDRFPAMLLRTILARRMPWFAARDWVGVWETKIMNIYVGNLPYRTTEQELTEKFGAFGIVKSSRIIKDRDSGQSKGFGFVEMPNFSEAQAAISAIDGKDFSGRTLKVNEARPKAQDTGGRFQRDAARSPRV
jgi:RNA recognition motif-containing protein